MNAKTKKQVINIRVSEEMKKDLKELADKDRRTLSDYMVISLEAMIRRAKEVQAK